MTLPTKHPHPEGKLAAIPKRPLHSGPARKFPTASLVRRTIVERKPDGARGGDRDQHALAVLGPAVEQCRRGCQRTEPEIHTALDATVLAFYFADTVCVVVVKGADQELRMPW